MQIVKTEQLSEQLSALVDGELGELETQRLLDSLAEDPDLVERWSHYHLVGDALHNNLLDRSDPGLARRISTALEREPVPIRAPNRRLNDILRPVAGLAIAASVAVVAVLGVQRLQDDGAAGPVVASRTSPGPVAEGPDGTQLAGTSWNEEQAGVRAKINDYLVNHSAYAGNGMNVVQPYVRVVGYHADN